MLPNAAGTLWRLHRAQRAPRGVVGHHVDGGVQFVQQIDKALALVPHEVARARFFGGHCGERGLVGGELSGFGIKAPSGQVVTAQACGEHIAVGGVGMDGVRIGRRG